VFGHRKGLEKKLMEDGGAVASAVLERNERWSSASGSGYGQPSKVTDHMRINLRVEPANEPAFEAEFSQAFSGSVPFTGWQCKVVYDSADHSKIAVVEGTTVPTGHHPRTGRAQRDASRRGPSCGEERPPRRIHRGNKAKALRGEIGGTVIVDGRMVSGASAPQPSVVDQLTNLAKLRESGALTEAEFQAEKTKLLADG
jgi:hypothetical protein